MKLEHLRANAIRQIEGIEGKEYKDGLPPVAALMDAKRIVQLCDEVFPTVTEDEKARIRAIPVWETNYEAVRDIKEKYGLSWSELKYLRDE